MLKIRRAKGEGQCQCTLCAERGNWNIMWCNFAYKIGGYDGVYCGECMEELTEGNYEYEEE